LWRGQRFEPAPCGVIQTPSNPGHALLDGFDLGRDLALHLADAPFRHHSSREQYHVDEVPIRPRNCPKSEIPEVETETWQHVGSQGWVIGEAEPSQ
jgi:hypothetical protein